MGLGLNTELPWPDMEDAEERDVVMEAGASIASKTGEGGMLLVLEELDSCSRWTSVY